MLHLVDFVANLFIFCILRQKYFLLTHTSFRLLLIDGIDLIDFLFVIDANSLRICIYRVPEWFNAR